MLGLLLGFLLNSGLRTYYSYLWWLSLERVGYQKANASEDEHGYPKAIYDAIGTQDNIKWLLITGDYSWGRWKPMLP